MKTHYEINWLWLNRLLFPRKPRFVLDFAHAFQLWRLGWWEGVSPIHKMTVWYWIPSLFSYPGTLGWTKYDCWECLLPLKLHMQWNQRICTISFPWPNPGRIYLALQNWRLVSRNRNPHLSWLWQPCMIYPQAIQQPAHVIDLWLAQLSFTTS